MGLEAVVEKRGEGNWTSIVGKDDFPFDRTNAQLSKAIFQY